jgi:hypothetical protein
MIQSTPRFLIIMKLFFFLWGFFTFSTAMPSEMRHGQEVEPPENQRVDQHSTQLQLVQPKDVSTVQGVNQTVEIRQAFVVLPILAIGIVGAGLLTALAIVVTLAVMEVKDNNVRNSWIL